MGQTNIINKREFLVHHNMLHTKTNTGASKASNVGVQKIKVKVGYLKKVRVILKHLTQV